MSGLKIWYTDGRLGKDYVPIMFDDLATHVDEMAAVAWDRDQEEVLRDREVEHDLRVMVSGRHVYLVTGFYTVLARWDYGLKVWIRL